MEIQNPTMEGNTWIVWLDGAFSKLDAAHSLMVNAFEQYASSAAFCRLAYDCYNAAVTEMEAIDKKNGSIASKAGNALMRRWRTTESYLLSNASSSEEFDFQRKRSFYKIVRESVFPCGARHLSV